MIWMPRLLGVQGKLGAAENERTAEARASRGAEEEGARAMVVAPLSSKLLLLLSATAESAMLHSLGITLEPNSPKEEEQKTPRPSRPSRHRKRIRRRKNALHRRKVVYIWGGKSWLSLLRSRTLSRTKGYLLTLCRGIKSREINREGRLMIRGGGSKRFRSELLKNGTVRGTSAKPPRTTMPPNFASSGCRGW